MRVLVLSNLYPPVVRGGYEVECRDVVEHLRARHDVTILTSVLGAEEEPGREGVRRVLPWTGEARKRDTVTAAASTRRAIAITRQVLDSERPDAVYVWNAAGVPAAVLRTLQTSGVPLLVRVCEYWFGGVYRHDQFTRYLEGGAMARGSARGLQRPWAALHRAVNRLPGWRVETERSLPAAVCWNSRFVAERAPAPVGVEVVHRAIVIPSNARTDHMATIPRAPVPGRFLFVGRLDERKGAATLVRALGLLTRSGDEADLVLVGDGSPMERAALGRLAAAEGVGRRVRMAGPLQGAAFDAEVSAASAWCVPSEWDEPAPLTCTEAALAGVPGVFARVGGIPEMFDEGVHALFHAPGDAPGVADALRVSMAGGPEVERRVARARERGRDLSFAPYLRAMDAFFAEGLSALGRPEARARG